MGLFLFAIGSMFGVSFAGVQFFIGELDFGNLVQSYLMLGLGVPLVLLSTLKLLALVVRTFP